VRTISIISAFLLFYLSCTSEKNLLPENFQGYILTKQINGEEAQWFANKLHSQTVATSKNEIGFYLNGNRSATIYISHYENKKLAQTAFKNMTDKISPQNSVFIEGTFLDVNGVRVYRCFGMGQTHFVFANEEKLFWLSVETTSGKQFLTKYLEYLN
jgi:hypothetical protein